MSNTTPEPWAITQTKVRNGYELIIQANMQNICAVYGSTTPLWDSVPGITTGRANARLIAAAPDLLEALRQVVAVYDGNHVGAIVGMSFDKARAAIAKATGEQA